MPVSLSRPCARTLSVKGADHYSFAFRSKSDVFIPNTDAIPCSTPNVGFRCPLSMLPIYRISRPARIGKLLLPHLLLPVGAFLTGIPLFQALLGAMNRLSSRRDVAVCRGASIPDCGTSYLARETTVSTG